MIAIKGMEMPSSCAFCEMRQHLYEHCMPQCIITKTCIPDEDSYERDKDCPLVEIEERKTGKWVKKYQYGNDYCSECNYENCGYGYPKFCPNCGARMVGAENG